MQNIFIVYLAAADRASLNFAGIEKDIEKHFGVQQAIYSTDLVEIGAFLQIYHTDTQPLTVTILAHGALKGICTKQSEDNWIYLDYKDLLPLIARSRTIHPIILNLTAPCFSNLVTGYIADYAIDEAWYTTGKSDSLHKSLNAVKEGFARFKFNDEQNLYRQYKKPA